MLDKEKCFESVVYAPKYNKINLVVPQKTHKIIFDTAWDMFHRYSYDKAVGCLDFELYDQANEYNLQCTYDKLINMYLKLHLKKNSNK